jgi:hypothetical protein
MVKKCLGFIMLTAVIFSISVVAFASESDAADYSGLLSFSGLYEILGFDHSQFEHMCDDEFFELTLQMDFSVHESVCDEILQYWFMPYREIVHMLNQRYGTNVMLPCVTEIDMRHHIMRIVSTISLARYEALIMECVHNYRKNAERTTMIIMDLLADGVSLEFIYDKFGVSVVDMEMHLSAVNPLWVEIEPHFDSFHTINESQFIPRSYNHLLARLSATVISFHTIHHTIAPPPPQFFTIHSYSIDFVFPHSDISFVRSGGTWSHLEGNRRRILIVQGGTLTNSRTGTQLTQDWIADFRLP